MQISVLMKYWREMWTPTNSRNNIILKIRIDPFFLWIIHVSYSILFICLHNFTCQADTLAGLPTKPDSWTIRAAVAALPNGAIMLITNKSWFRRTALFELQVRYVSRAPDKFWMVGLRGSTTPGSGFDPKLGLKEKLTLDQGSDRSLSKCFKWHWWYTNEKSSALFISFKIVVNKLWASKN